MPVSETTEITLDELQLATRNHGLPLEALRYPITPPGLHYLLIHYDIPVVDASTWRLEIGGHVARPLSLTLADLQSFPYRELAVTLECAGNGRARLSPRPISQPWLVEAVGTARWGGTPLAPLLAQAEPLANAADVVFGGADHGIEGGEEQRYARSLALADALDPELLLAWHMNGQPLPPQHGYPLRLVAPGWYGMASVKWLTDIRVVDEPFDGYQMRQSYRLRQLEDDPGEPVTRMQPRALMVPPGIPEFATRARTVPFGPVRLIGRAWSGLAPVAAVEVSDDGGETWAAATIERDVDSRWAWVAWQHTWQPERPGDYVLLCRARDEAGNEQPAKPRWNVGGYANNAAHEVRVTVADQLRS